MIDINVLILGCGHFFFLIVYQLNLYLNFWHNTNQNVQAPVSDREYRATLPETAAMIDLASTMINEGRGSELMPSEADLAPITAYRWVHNNMISL